MSETPTTDSFRDPEALKQLYWEEGMSTHEVADRLGCHHTTVLDWMDRFDIPTRSKSPTDQPGWGENPVPLETTQRGYERWKYQYQYERHSVRVHRLLAVAEYGFEAVRGMSVHHKNNIPWDNRHENVVPMPHGEHTTLHKTKEAGGGA